jgi:hypothetical protein
VRRRLFNALAAVSLVFFLALAALAIRTFWALDAVQWERPTASTGVRWLTLGTLHRGRVGAYWVSAQQADLFGRWQHRAASSSDHPSLTYHHAPSTSTADMNLSDPNLSPYTRFAHGGIYYVDFSMPGIGNSGIVLLPVWWPLLLTSLLPVWWLRRKMRDRRRVQHTICRVCGYDLRATPARCPECGTVAAAHAVE